MSDLPEITVIHNKLNEACAYFYGGFAVARLSEDGERWEFEAFSVDPTNKELLVSRRITVPMEPGMTLQYINENSFMQRYFQAVSNDLSKHLISA